MKREWTYMGIAEKDFKKLYQRPFPKSLAYTADKSYAAYRKWYNKLSLTKNNEMKPFLSKADFEIQFYSFTLQPNAPKSNLARSFAYTQRELSSKQFDLLSKNLDEIKKDPQLLNSIKNNINSAITKKEYEELERLVNSSKTERRAELYRIGGVKMRDYFGLIYATGVDIIGS